jgi:hypothetical protein
MKRKRNWLIPAGVFAVLVGLMVLVMREPQPAQPPTVDNVTPAPAPKGPSPEELRRQARLRAERQLAWANSECTRLVARDLKPVESFFKEARRGSSGFADEALGWKSKWLFVKDRLPFTNGGRHKEFIADAFGRHLFTSEQLAQLLEQVLSAFAADVASVENQMLVRLREDLGDLPAEVLAVPANDFKAAYDRALAKSLHEAQGKVQDDITADLGSLAISEVLALVARRLAVSGGMLGAGAAGSWGSFGFTLVVGVLVDQFVTWIWDWFADPKGKLSQTVDDRLQELHHNLIDGDPESPGLRQSLKRWNEERARVRRIAVLGMLEKGGQ